jgi:hypothetical protein
MTFRTLRFLCVGLAVTSACAPAAKQEAPADLAAFAHERLPDDVEHRTFVDFGSKVELVAYDVSPAGSAKPGDSVKMTLYWKRTGQLEPGWRLFTHVDDDQGRQISNFDREGAFRSALGAKESGLSILELGKVYTDEQTFAVPKADVVTPKITIVVGVWNEAMRATAMPLQSSRTFRRESRGAGSSRCFRGPRNDLKTRSSHSSGEHHATRGS